MGSGTAWDAYTLHQNKRQQRGEARRRGRDHIETEREIRVGQPRGLSLQRLGDGNKDSFLEFGDSKAQQVPPCHLFGFQNCLRIHSCCSKPPNSNNSKGSMNTYCQPRFVSRDFLNISPQFPRVKLGVQTDFHTHRTGMWSELPTPQPGNPCPQHSAPHPQGLLIVFFVCLSVCVQQ